MATAESPLQQCINHFNVDPKNGILALSEAGFVSSDNPTSIAVFLFSNSKQISSIALGKYLCNDEERVLVEYVNLLSLSGLHLDAVLRAICQRVAVPLERESLELFLRSIAANVLAAQQTRRINELHNCIYSSVPEIVQCMQLLLKWNSLRHGRNGMSGNCTLTSTELVQEVHTFLSSYFAHLQHLKVSSPRQSVQEQYISSEMLNNKEFLEMFVRINDAPIEVAKGTVSETPVISHRSATLGKGTSGLQVCQGWLKIRSRGHLKHIVKFPGLGTWKTLWVALSDTVLYCYHDESESSPLRKMIPLSACQCSLTETRFSFRLTRTDERPLRVVKFSHGDSPKLKSNADGTTGDTHQSKYSEIQLCALDDVNFTKWYNALSSVCGIITSGTSPKAEPSPNMHNILGTERSLPTQPPNAHVGEPAMQFWLFHCDGNGAQKTKHFRRVYASLYLTSPVFGPRLYLFPSEQQANQMSQDGYLSHCSTMLELSYATEVCVSDTKVVQDNSWFGLEIRLLGRHQIFATESPTMYTSFFRTLSGIVQGDIDSMASTSEYQQRFTKPMQNETQLPAQHHSANSVYSNIIQQTIRKEYPFQEFQSNAQYMLDQNGYNKYEQIPHANAEITQTPLLPGERSMREMDIAKTTGEFSNSTPTGFDNHSHASLQHGTSTPSNSLAKESNTSGATTNFSSYPEVSRRNIPVQAAPNSYRNETNNAVLGNSQTTNSLSSKYPAQPMPPTHTSNAGRTPAYSTPSNTSYTNSTVTRGQPMPPTHTSNMYATQAPSKVATPSLGHARPSGTNELPTTSHSIPRPPPGPPPPL